MTLYEISDNYLQLLAAIEAGDIPEEAISDTLEAVEGELDDKIDNIACYIKSLRAEAEIIKAEEHNLAARRKAKESKAERLAEYLSDAMQRSNKTKLETARNKISFRRSYGTRITDEEAFIEWAEQNAPDAIKKTVTVKPVLAVVKELCKTTNLPFAVVEETQNIQIK